MTWDQIREVDRGGLTVGAHTHTHRVLGTLTPDQQREELRQSLAILELELGREVRTLAYPVGEERHVTAETRGLAAECGFEIAFSYLTGANLQGRTDPLWVRRTDGPGDLQQLAASTLLPEVFLLRLG
jgi:peptidoglycan/xylan/chitin deacetylase (PgdA/CDA1 family)